MPIYYHIRRGKNPIKFDKNKTMFLSKKNSLWYNIEKSVSNDKYYDYSYYEYKINIPRNRFTTSLNPRDKTKILILNKKNIKEFRKIYPKRGDEGDDFGGIDATNIKSYKFHYHDELVLRNFKKVEIEMIQINL